MEGLVGYGWPKIRQVEVLMNQDWFKARQVKILIGQYLNLKLSNKIFSKSNWLILAKDKVLDVRSLSIRNPDTSRSTNIKQMRKFQKYKISWQGDELVLKWCFSQLLDEINWLMQL